MGRVVPVFFDFACPFSYSARVRDRGLARELGVRFAHLPWQLAPGLPREGREDPHAEVPPRLERFARACGARVRPRPRVHDTRLALRGVLYARAVGAEEAYVDRAFEAYWDEQADVHDGDVLRRVARESGMDEDEFARAVQDEALDVGLAAVDGWGRDLGVSSTVTYVLDGRPVKGLGSVDEMRAALRRVVDARS